MLTVILSFVCREGRSIQAWSVQLHAFVNGYLERPIVFKQMCNSVCYDSDIYDESSC